MQKRVAKAHADAHGQNVLVACDTHEEIARVTEAIRAKWKRSGALGESAVWSSSEDLIIYGRGERISDERPGSR